MNRADRRREDKLQRGGGDRHRLLWPRCSRRVARITRPVVYRRRPDSMKPFWHSNQSTPKRLICSGWWSIGWGDSMRPAS